MMSFHSFPIHRTVTLTALVSLGGLLGACIKDVGVTQCPDGLWCSPGYACVDTNSDGVYECVIDTCGNGVVDHAGEQCDEGSLNSDTEPDACRTNCQWARCGDGVVDSGEACDDRNNEDCDGCRGDCSAVESGCGDGFLCGDEVCDDGNNEDCDGCRGDCSGVEWGCGDGYLCGDEECDDGNNEVNDDCPSGPQAGLQGCKPARCGDGFLKTAGTPPYEACDDGNDIVGDACPSGPNGTCQPAFCGDGIVLLGVELCDCGTDPDNLPPGCTMENSNEAGASCRLSCTPPACGDGVVDEVAGEQCDDPNGNSDTNPDACRTNCLNAWCGDGVVDPGNSEACDCGYDPNNLGPGCTGINSDLAPAPCRTNCTFTNCGDGIVDPGEQCDDANTSNNDDCLNSCQNASCGDGHLWNEGSGTEECDQGTLNSDIIPNRCRTSCTLPLCGDGVTDDLYGEECDDGAANSNTLPNRCRTNCLRFHCGDGVIDAGEACDDGNNIDDDGCRNNCTLPSCGDGVVQLGEDCDTFGVDTDTCNANCRFAVCGDGYVNLAANEVCDDGGTDDCSGTCNALCSGPANTCGDGVIRCSEECDDGGESASCNANCTVASCGDGIVNVTRGEVCDDGGTDDCSGTCNALCSGPANTCGDGVVRCGEQCDSSGSDTMACNGGICTTPTCGDGYLNLAANEACDDGGNDDCAGTCNADCSGPANACGDGILRCGEACDDGGTDSCSGTCNATCTGPANTCGDGIPRCGEVCDDGGNDDCAGTCNAGCTGPSNTCGDGIVRCGEDCDSSGLDTLECNGGICTFVSCGDGYHNQAAELCDDGFTDECVGACNATCDGPGNICGDGIVRCGETCDSTGIDTNTCDGGDCTAPQCGDGYLNLAAEEACDDGFTDECVGTCNADCTGPGNTCGDGIIRCGEQCEGLDLNGQDCESVLGAGFGGVLACTPGSCAFDTSGCFLACVVHADCPLGRQCIGSVCELAGDTCDAADMPTVISGYGSHQLLGETNRNLTHDYTGRNCGGIGANNKDGPDKVYVLNLAAGDYVVVWLETFGFDGAVYLSSDCPDIVANCVAGADRSNAVNKTERIDFVASSAGAYYLVVDGQGSGSVGEFNLYVTIGNGAVSANAAGQMIISEVMNYPRGNADNCEWFEIYNTTSESLNLQGVSFHHDGNSFLISGDLIATPGEYMVISRIYNPAGGTHNCGLLWVSESYGTTLNLRRGTGTHPLAIQRGALVLDEIVYVVGGTTPWPGSQGNSMYLCTNHLNATDNDSRENWGETPADGAYVYGSVSDNYGTPAASNPGACNPP